MNTNLILEFASTFAFMYILSIVLNEPPNKETGTNNLLFGTAFTTVFGLIVSTPYATILNFPPSACNSATVGLL